MFLLFPFFLLYPHTPMSLYRTYRPKGFADVVGQDHIVTTLEQAMKQGKLGHAYLFAGQRGTGKTSVARILAKALMTDGMDDEQLRMQIIRAADDGSLVDLTEIDAASTRGIDDIRGLLEKIQFTPIAAKAKVFIIDEVHMLTREAFNALLKTLEEPPPYAFFILATTELFKIPPTIQSRCQRFLFRQVREEEIVRRLQYVADQERITADRAALRAIAHSAGGSMRDALSLLDQLRSLETITLDDVKLRIGETGHEHVEAMLQAIDARDGATVLALVNNMEEAAVPMEGFLRLMLGEVRERMHADIENGNGHAEHLRRMDTLLRAAKDIRSAPVPGLAVESALLSLCGSSGVSREPSDAHRAAPAPAPAAPRNEEMLRAAETVLKKTVAKAHTPPPAPATIEAPALSLDALRQAWASVVDAATPPSVRMSLKNGRVTSVSGSTVTLQFGSAFHRDKVAATEASRTIEGILQNVFKQSVRLHCELESEQSSAPAADDVVNLADAAAEIF